jgi:hypothetical protein
MRRMLVLLLTTASLGCARLSGPPAIDASFPPPRDAQAAEQRLAFLESRLDAGRLHAQIWNWGWLAVNTGGLASSVANAATTDQGDKRAFNIVQASQAALGLTDMLVFRPMPGTHGADPLREAAARGASVEERVPQGERMLVDAAKRADDRHDWRVHAGNAALQVVSASVLFALDEPGYAGLTLGIGLVAGEAFIWSEPHRALGDLAEYRKLVETGVARRDPGMEFRFGPSANGVALELRY